MHRTPLLAVLAVSSLLLAGCSGSPADEPPAPTASSSTSTGPAPKPIPTTDTLHMLAAPEMTPDVTRLGSEERSPVTAGGGGFGGGQQDGATWNYVVQTPTNVSGGEIHIWVDIKETMVESPVPPQQPPCTWRLELEVGADSPFTLCLAEPPGPIQVQVKELVFRLDVVDTIDLEVGETITASLHRNAFSPSLNNAVDALSGSTEHDSFVQLRGLIEPAEDR